MKCVSSYFNTKTYKSQPRRQNASGFTIVELLIVIVVIAILATIAIVSYSGIQRNAINAAVQSTLSSAATAMKLEAVKSESFSSIPGSVKPPERVGLALTELPPPLSPSTSFCMNGTYQGNNDVAFHVTEGGSPEEGLCEGEVIPATVVGDYNFEAAGGSEPIANLINPVTVEGDLYGFKVATNKAWDKITLSWDSQPGSTRYEVQSATANSTQSWSYRLKEDGSGSGAYNVPTLSGQIDTDTTSLTWTDRSYAIPYSAGQTYYYRLRPCDGLYSGNCSAWTTVSLANPTQSPSDVPDVENFSVTPSGDWSSVSLSWKRVPNYSTNMPMVRYEVQSGSSNSVSVLSYRSKSDGSGSGGYNATTHSGQIQVDTTSLTWTDHSNAVPYSAGQTYYYRIRTCAGTYQNMCSAWKMISLQNPTQSPSDVPAVSGLKVTPSSNWSNVTISWDRVPNYSTNMPQARYEVQTNPVPSGGTWSYRNKTDGSGSGGYNATTHSGQVPIDTTSFTWTDTSYSVPQAGNKVYRYRIRTCAGLYQSFCGSWNTVTLTRP